MRTVNAEPIFYSCEETGEFLDHLAENIKKKVGKDADLLLDHPSIYIHVWRSNYDVMNATYSIYIGETNDIVQRTKEHWNAARIPKSKRKEGNWQHHMLEDIDEDGDAVIPRVYFFGHKLFHKSLTLDVENRLIDYCYAMHTAHIYNGRTNPQGNYSGEEYLDDIFSMIWKKMRKENSKLFLPVTEIQKSAIYKASPNHKLTDEQKRAKGLIIDRATDAILKNKTGQLIFVEGEAGTGKTVLTSSVFYDMLASDFRKDFNVKCYLLINHMEQKTVYENMARKTGFDEDIIQLPTAFLNSHSVLNKSKDAMEPDKNNIADIVFVDEAHLLWNARNQSYTKKYKNPQLDEIIKRARITVIMFDENQVLHKGQVFSQVYIDSKRDLARNQGPNPSNGENNYIVLNNQLRMNCDQETLSWIDAISKELKVIDLDLDKKSCDKRGYEIRIFDEPSKMHEAIKKKAKKDESQLSRMVATLDWDYINRMAPPPGKHYWDVRIGDYSIPWHEEIFLRDIYHSLSKREVGKYRRLDWAEKDYTLDEAGSIFTIQGFDLSYVGVILGPSVRYDKEKNSIWFSEQYKSQDYMKGFRTMTDGSSINVTDLIAKHELRVLMTRGTHGLFIYACDPELRRALKESVTITK